MEVLKTRMVVSQLPPPLLGHCLFVVALGCFALCSITIGSGIGTERNAHCIDNIMCVNIRFRCERIHRRAFLETENVRYEQIIQAYKHILMYS